MKKYSEPPLVNWVRTPSIPVAMRQNLIKSKTRNVVNETVAKIVIGQRRRSHSNEISVAVVEPHRRDSGDIGGTVDSDVTGNSNHFDVLVPFTRIGW